MLRLSRSALLTQQQWQSSPLKHTSSFLTFSHPVQISRPYQALASREAVRREQIFVQEKIDELTNKKTIEVADERNFRDIVHKASLVRDDGTLAFSSLMAGRAKGIPIERRDFNNTMNKLSKAANSRLARILWDTVFHELAYFKNTADATEKTRTYNYLLSAYANDGYISKALEVLEEMKQLEIPRDVFTYNMLLNGKHESSPIGQIELILKKTEEDGIAPDTVTFNTAIAVAARCHNPTEAFRLFDLMIEKDLSPDKFTFRSLFTSMMHVKHNMGHWFSKARQLWQVLEEDEGGERVDANVLESYIQMLSSIGHERLARNIVKAWSAKYLWALTPGTWASLLKSQRKEVDLEKAELFIKQLATIMGRYHVVPTVEFYNELILVYSSFRNEKAFNRVKSVLPSIKSRKLFPNITTFNCLIAACGPVKQLEKAKEYFEKISKDLHLQPSFVSYTSLIGVAVQCDDMEYAETLFAEMKEEKIRINDFTYNHLIRGYINCQQFDKAEALLEVASAENGLKPFNFVVLRMQLLLAKGEYDAMFDLNNILLEKYNVRPNYTCSKLLLQSAYDRKDRELAFKVQKQMVADRLVNISRSVAQQLVDLLEDDWFACREWLDFIVQEKCNIGQSFFVEAARLVLRTQQLEGTEAKTEALQYLLTFLSKHRLTRDAIRELVPEEMKEALADPPKEELYTPKFMQGEEEVQQQYLRNSDKPKRVLRDEFGVKHPFDPNAFEYPPPKHDYQGHYAEVPSDHSPRHEVKEKEFEVYDDTSDDKEEFCEQTLAVEGVGVEPVKGPPRNIMKKKKKLERAQLFEGFL